MTRPSLDEVLAYRREIDRRMAAWLGEAPNDARRLYLFTLGLHHDQQHQELFLMDILNLLALSPLDPAAFATEPRACPAQPARGGTSRFEGGLVEIGPAGTGFAFDNEGPAHRVWLEPYALANDLTTNADWIAFMDDDGYGRPELWLSDGWATVQAQGWQAPLYWQCEDGHWTTMGLAGRTPVAPASPVRHISFYEADAFARWAGKRLPGEAEWEHAVRCRPEALANAFGEVWQWTASAYAPYPGFRPTEGTASEYNGKFMANQMVLRGSSFATPDGHARVSYRNFFYPHQRWAFAGLRLAEDAPAPPVRSTDQGETAGFRRDLVAGLSRSPKVASPKWFYDAEGSRLFEAITRLPEYYPTRQEAALLRRVAPGWAARFGPGAVLVEFGSGASEKTRIVLDAAPEAPKSLERSHLAALGADSAEEDLGLLVQAIIAGNGSAAERQLRLLEGSSAIPALRALARRLLQMAEARAAVDAGQQPQAAVKALRPPIFWKDVDMVAASLGRWPMPRIRQALAALLAGEQAIKTPRSPGDTAGWQVIAALAQPRLGMGRERA
jgi:ergothioneine biosynthesis protein EgtB